MARRSDIAIRLAIADAGDSVLDSAVFLHGFADTPTPPGKTVPEPSAIIGLLAVGFGGSLLKKKIHKA
jgi:hypothetical protein